MNDLAWIIVCICLVCRGVFTVPRRYIHHSCFSILSPNCTFCEPFSTSIFGTFPSLPWQPFQAPILYLCRYQIHHQSHLLRNKTGTSDRGRIWRHPYPRRFGSKSPPRLQRIPCSSRSHPGLSSYSAEGSCIRCSHKAQDSPLHISRSK